MATHSRSVPGGQSLAQVCVTSPCGATFVSRASRNTYAGAPLQGTFALSERLPLEEGQFFGFGKSRKFLRDCRNVEQPEGKYATHSRAASAPDAERSSGPARPSCSYDPRTGIALVRWHPCPRPPHPSPDGPCEAEAADASRTQRLLTLWLDNWPILAAAAYGSWALHAAWRLL